MSNPEPQVSPAILELPDELYQRLTSLANLEQIPVSMLLERLVAAYRPLRSAVNLPHLQGTVLGEAVPHEEIHVWDRPQDDFSHSYAGDLSD